MAALILFGPVLALLVVVAVEALADVLRIASAPAVGAMAGVIRWVLVLKYRTLRSPWAPKGTNEAGRLPPCDWPAEVERPRSRQLHPECNVPKGRDRGGTA